MYFKRFTHNAAIFCGNFLHAYYHILVFASQGLLKGTAIFCMHTVYQGTLSLLT